MSVTQILPVYHRIVNGVPVPFTRRSFRAKEKYVIFLVFVTFGLICFGTFFFLPEFRGSNGPADSMYKVYDQIKRAGPELLIPPPPHLEDSREAQKIVRHETDAQLDPHIIGDRQKLKAKIEQDSELKVLERPDLGVRKTSSTVGRLNVPNQVDENVGAEDLGPNYPVVVTVPPAMSDSYPLMKGGEDLAQQTRERRDKVKEMTKHAWDNYVRYAWGKNELRPISKRGHTGSIFGSMPIAATILDGLDTLYIMGMMDEFKQAKDFVANEFDVNTMANDVSVFEVNIRFVGGLLTCFAMTGDVMFRDKAQQIAQKLLPAFDTPTGIPNALVNFKTGTSKNYGWASGGSSILSEFGTLQLEFSYLSDVTGNPVYKQKVEHIRQFLQGLDKPNGLYPNYLNPKTGKWGQHHMSMGALGDSFYEYLLKAWLQTNKEDNEVRQMFDDAMQAVIKHMLHTSQNGMMYFAELKFDRPEHKMDHLGCFSGGLFALASHTLKNSMSDKYMEIAKNITNTCHESYDRSATKLGPEAFRFTEGSEARALKSSEKYYILRPEVIESYFYLYRLTKDEKYRDWGWEAVQALEKYCRVPGGYTGLKNVYSEDPQQDDVQQSFFIAEVLKYLYLLFSDDELFSLDKWVFNTEGHPLPIKGVNPYYREASP
ncbi:mannosyl-oligosaccharide 1,2-alpha-mannosidase IA-like isoform X1 [Aethina tumida]|uniref:mannosyl-oligosaccharide 1,2-alpha-mannosidase IA-like isoform X1 n=1 Tax=Aethina tumida TaxID=116153 RepID=UPI0021472708|nr:mannosyl-oligosaccharide 1,2-alpha-mannosidase IA-like isoform X1 [Aethina tumida]